MQPDYQVVDENSKNGSLWAEDLSFLRTLIRLHSKSIENFILFTRESKSSVRKWLELVYCILAGAQIKSTLVYRIYQKLWSNHLDDLMIKNLCDCEFSPNRIEQALKSYGYRFYKSKAQTIREAASLFKKYDYDVENFLRRFPEYRTARRKLCEVRGIGYKIASHWLRNIGYDIPIVDQHVKRLLHRFSLINERASYLEYEDFLFKVSRLIEKNCTTVDLAIWLHGIKYCSKRKCEYCPVSDRCSSKVMSKV